MKIYLRDSCIKTIYREINNIYDMLIRLEMEMFMFVYVCVLEYVCVCVSVLNGYR